jgi:hypothetical protein
VGGEVQGTNRLKLGVFNDPGIDSRLRLVHASLLVEHHTLGESLFLEVFSSNPALNARGILSRW